MSIMGVGCQRLGWPGLWYNGHLYDDGGLPVHLYPFRVTADGRGPCDESDPEYDHDICWCHLAGCTGSEDTFGFPLKEETDDQRNARLAAPDYRPNIQLPVPRDL